MANSLTPFNFGQSTIRTATIGAAAWFVATDVCSALGYKNTSKAIGDHLDADEKGMHNVPTPNAPLGVPTTIINESGLYALVLRSRKPEARKFAKWVTREVLPAIRKTGGYEGSPAKSSSPTTQSSPEVELAYQLTMEMINAGRFDFEQISGLAFKSGMQLSHMVNQSVVGERVREIKSQLLGMNLAEITEITALSGALAVGKVAVINKRGRESGPDAGRSGV